MVNQLYMIFKNKMCDKCAILLDKTNKNDNTGRNCDMLHSIIH